MEQHAIDIWNAGVAAVHGRTLVESSVRIESGQLVAGDTRFSLDDFDRILVVGGGKFSHLMAEGLEATLGEKLCRQKGLSGLVTVPDGCESELAFIEAAHCRPAGVNLPTERVIEATRRMVGLLQQCDERTLVIALISGGGSALIEDSPLPLEDVITATQWLSLRAANIIQLNRVRVAISDVKGGGIAKAALPGSVLGLIVSDVPGDDIRFVSSGPTVPFGKNPYASAKEVLQKFEADRQLSGFPDSVLEFINRKITGRRESDLHGDPYKADSRIQNVMIGDASIAISAAAAKARQLGYDVLDSDPLRMCETCWDVSEAAAGWCATSRAVPSCCISIGEPVASPGKDCGKGGRNQHAVLGAICNMLEVGPLAASHSCCFLSAGTDGEDGNTTVAGAFVTAEKIRDLAGASGQAEEAAKSLMSYRVRPRRT